MNTEKQHDISDPYIEWPQDPRTFVTRSAASCTTRGDQVRAVARHCHHEWGDIDDKRRAYNAAAIEQRSGSVVSLHTSTSGEPFVVVSNARFEIMVVASPYELDFFDASEVLAVLQRCPNLEEIETPE